MKKSEWNEGVNNIDVDLVEEYVKKKEKLTGKKSRSSSLLRYGAVAACVMLVLGAVIAVPTFRRSEDPKIPLGDKVESGHTVAHSDLQDSVTQTSDIKNNFDFSSHEGHVPQILDKTQDNVDKPYFDSTILTITLSADDISKVFEVSDDYKVLGTNLYKEIYTYSEDHLNIKGVPDTEYLPVYATNEDDKTEAKFSNFIDKYLKLTPSLFYLELTSRTLKKFSDYDVAFGSFSHLGMLYKGLDFSSLYNGFICSYSDKDTKVLKYLKNLPDNVILLETDTDEQVAEKLKETMSTVCGAFDKEYSNIRIERNYAVTGLDTLCVYLYTPSETAFLDGYYRNSYTDNPHPMMSEYIKLTYLNEIGPGHYMNHWGGEKGELALTRISVFEAFTSSYEYYNVIGKSKMISIKEAEELLNKGYVFGGYHVCPICLAHQPSVDFSDYDFVDLEYIKSFEENIIIPFYAFYKYTGENWYGTKTYAKTYVPAIELEGLDEYFANQVKSHQDLLSQFEEIPIERVIE